MKTRTAVVTAALAVALGATTGGVLLPHDSGRGDDPAAGPPSSPVTPATGQAPSSAAPSRSPSSGVAAFGTGALLTAGDLAANGYAGGVTPKLGTGGGGFALSACTGEEQLSDIVPEGTRIAHGLWRGAGGDVATEQAVEVGSPEQSVRLASRTFEELTACQREPAGHWRYGLDQSFTIKRLRIYGDWMSVFNGSADGTGLGPACGGAAVVVNGARFAVLEIDWCTSGDHVAGIAKAAAVRLHRS